MSEAPVQLFARRTAKRRKSELVADCKTAVEGNVASPVRTAGSSETAALPLPERGANQASSSGRSHDGANATKIKSDESAPPPTSFRELGVSEWLCGVLRGLGITQPTAVQAGCIPAALAGRDVIGTAQTGSGKTAAFALPILQQLAADPYGVFALVLTPTR
jgi:ATP-dependent RNA helicase DDX49/DBP8